MRNSIILLVLFSLLIFSGCPSTNDSYEDEDSYVEENAYEEEFYEEEYYEEESDKEKEPHHLENPADIAGDLIF